MSATCVIASFGEDPIWGVSSDISTRAVMSVANQTKVFDQCLRIHIPGGTLQQARNQGAKESTSEWLCFLDCDDELDPGYHEAMMRVTGDIRRPSTLGIVNGVEDDEPYMIERASLRLRNFIVIGAFIRREQFLRVGGFGNDAMLEDWDLWIRMHLDGAEIVDVPDAVYRVHVREDSRNSSHRQHYQSYSDIKNRYRDRWNVVKSEA